MNDVNLNPETQTDVSKLEVLISRQQLQERIRELGQLTAVVPTAITRPPLSRHALTASQQV